MENRLGNAPNLGEPELLSVKPADRLASLHGSGDHSGNPRGRGARHQFEEMLKSKDHFRVLAQAAEDANGKLVLNKAPYRFCVYEQGNRVMIDVVLLDSSGKIRETIRRDITDEDFHRWVEDMSQMEGLLLDRNG